MLISSEANTFSIPHTSTCIIHTKGVIKDKSIVSITSPIFSSTNFTSRSINMSAKFDIPIRVLNKEGYITNVDKIEATLVCNDNDVFNMHVLIN